MNLKWGPSSQLGGRPASDLHSRERAMQGGTWGLPPCVGHSPRAVEGGHREAGGAEQIQDDT